MMLAGKRVLVTGARGFLGSALTHRLQTEDAEVHAVTRAGSRPTDTDGGGPQWWTADLTQPAVVADLCRMIRPHVIYHLSGHVTAAPEIDAVLPTFQSLAESTVYLLSGAVRAGCERIVLAGSLVEPAATESDWAPGSPYAAAKWTASVYGRMFQALYRAPVVITHLGYTYGPGQHAHRLIPSVIDALLRNEAPRLTSGTLRADWTYLGDMIDGLIAAATADEAIGRTVDIGSGTLTSVRDVVGHLVRLAGVTVQPRFGALPDRPQEQFRPAATARTAQLIGWQATTGLELGLRRTVDWYRARQAAPQARPA
jgi:nucleoside-diphosphate-sugar epimerase